MSKLNEMQSAIVEAIKNYKSGSRGLVVCFEQVVSNYYDKDQFSPHNIEFFINMCETLPVLQSKMIRIVADKSPQSIIGLSVKKDAEKAGHFKVSNIKLGKAETKAHRAKCQENLIEFMAKEYTSLLNVGKAETTQKVKTDDEKMTSVIKSTIKLFDKAEDEGISWSVLKRIIELKEAGRVVDVAAMLELAKTQPTLEEAEETAGE